MNFNNFRNVGQKQNVKNINNTNNTNNTNNANNNYNLEVSKEDIKVEFAENKDNINTMFLNNTNNFQNFQKEEIIQGNYENIPPLRSKYQNNINTQEDFLYNKNIEQGYIQENINNFNNFNNKEKNIYKDKLNNQIYYNYLDNNYMENFNKKRPESLINKFPIMTDKVFFNNDYNKNDFNNKQIIEMLEHNIISKIKKINYYNNLLPKIKNEEERIILNEIKLDKQKHEKLLLEIYKTINQKPKENFIDYCKEENIIISEDIKKEYKKCISLELNSIEFFKRLYFIVENIKIKNLLYEIIIDNLCHSLKLNYCILNY